MSSVPRPARSPLGRRSPFARRSPLGRRSPHLRALGALLLLLATLAVAPALGQSPSPDPAAGPIASVGPSASPSGVPTPEPTPRVRPGPTLPPLDRLPRLDPTVPGPELGREVVAYLPYWMSNAGFQGAPAFDPATDPWIRDRRITDLVLFSVGIRRDGALKLDEANARFVLGPAATRIIRAAHRQGIRVLVSFVSGGYDNNAALFRDMRAAQRFVREAAALVALRGLDGADMDVELIKKPYFRNYARTAGLLKARLRLQDPASRVTVATNGAKSGATMAKMALSTGVDRAFLMGYAYRSGGSSPVGSISPLHHPTDLDLLESLDLYRARGIDLSRVILGLPTYGMTWPTQTSLPNAERVGSKRFGDGQVTGFHRALAGEQPFGAMWDEVPGDPSARRRWWDWERGTWWQTYVDTPATWRPKLLVALEQDLAGVGLWAIGYEGGLQGYPDMMGEVLARPVVAGGSLEPAVGTGLDIRVSARVLDVLAPTRWVQLSDDGVAWSPPLPPDALAGVPWRLPEGVDGKRVVLVRSRDLAGRLSVPYALTAIVDREGPTVVAGLRRAADRWWIGLAQADLTGMLPVQVRHRVADGDWSAWRFLRTPGDASVAAPEGVPVTVEIQSTDPLGNVRVTSVPAP